MHDANIPFDRLFGRLFGRRASPGAVDGKRRRAQRLAHTALELYGLHDAGEVELLSHDFVQVFRVRSYSRGEFALRLYGLPEGRGELRSTPRATDSRSVTAALRSPRVLHSQLAWLSALRGDTGLLVPDPVSTLDGELVGQVRVEGTPWRRRSTLMRWVHGIHKGENLSEADLSHVGSFVATMHDHAEGYVVPEGSEFPRWDWHWAFGETAPVWEKGPEFYSEEQMKTFRPAAQRIRASLDELGEGRDAFGLTHRDLKVFNNIVFSGEEVGVIDFDMCGLGYYLFDLSVIRRSLNATPAERRRGLWEAFLSGYEDVRPLPERVRSRLEHYLVAFDALQRAATINRWLQMLSSGTLEPRAREESLRFLTASHRWLKRQVQHVG